ncbi:MAG: isovaleryl-CoA dehydrogenase [Armatimonadota bacterium]|nr:isovaleryl-CoA dehydrogenase [Armatimonadota bacterium]MDR5697891.1 isovaleryl-CoA dehydrogenase [Armatimonadota bacterium]
MATHEVTNQPPPLVGYDAYTADLALVEAVCREGGGWAEGELRKIGAFCGSAAAHELGFLANGHPPVLHTHDRFGFRRDEVTYHPAYHELMRHAVAFGAHAAPWGDPHPGAHVVRAAKFFLLTQVEAGHGCPVSMTYAAVPALRTTPDVASEWEGRLFSRVYDPSFRPVSEKAGALMGMAMTEKQGGSDVRANTTRAEPIGKPGPGGEYRITGHKWFCSAPMSDAFLVLAQAPGGLSCFLLPRWTPDGQRNAFFLQRLKDKLGNRSNASVEVEFDGAWARMVGEEGRGVRTILEMVTHTRLDCVIGSAAGMRHAVAEAIHHAAHRRAFGRLLLDQPLMQNVLADLALESEAATVLAMRLARAYDTTAPEEVAFRRLATAVAKYWVCKRTPPHAAEALECLGGNGYVEESVMPRLFRESPLNGLWEGAGNVICLDVLRAIRRDPQSVEAFWNEVRLAHGGDARLDAFVRRLERDIAEPDEAAARRLTEDMALALQASLLVCCGPPAVADAFCASRLGADPRRAFGTLPAGVDLSAIVERARPRLP